MEQIKGIKVNGTEYAVNITDSNIETHITSPGGKDFTLKVDEKGGVYGYKAGVNESFPYSGNSGSGNEISFTDKNTSTRQYSATVEDGQFKITEKIGRTINLTSIDGKTTQDPISKQTFPLVINEIYANDRIESLNNPKHDTTLPVSHNFIEIASYDSENVIDLSNVYLQYFDNTTKKWDVLKLKGHINPFSSYLIRGAQVAPENAPSTIIDVSTFDIEWYDASNNLKAFNNSAGAFYLTTDSTPFDKSTDSSLVGSVNPALKLKINKTTGFMPIRYIDLVGWGSSTVNEAKAFTNVGNNIVIVRRNMFDKTTQANPKSIDKRTNDSGTLKYLDAVYVDQTYLGNEKDYRPMASWEGKNLYTTRSDFRENHPYCVSVSFGIDATTTRCFNWVSPGFRDEYLFYRPKGTSTWIIKESYKKDDGQDTSLRYTTPGNVYIPCYDRMKWETSGGRFMTTHKVIIKNNVTTDIDGNKTPLASSLSYYTDNTLKTTSGSATEFTKGKEYEYCVGPAEKDRYGTIIGPKTDECSEIFYFQVRNKVSNKAWSYIEHSDEQGFHWMEYEVWRRVANIMRAQFNPQFTINAGDMTQSGNRMNEWIDYNKGIEALAQGRDFSIKLGDTTKNPKNATVYSNQSAGVEQMNVVGNNDLAPVLDYTMSTGNDAKDPTQTGAKNGKCSPHQFNYFYCYEIDPANVPAIYNDSKTEIKFVIPSCYSFNYNNCHFTAICSEITKTYSQLVYGDNAQQNTYDIIQNWIQKDLDKWYMFSLGNKNKASKAGLYPWAVCYMHEMPFTVIVQSVAVTTNTAGVRNGGCKLNDNGTKPFSIAELFQRNNIRLIMGGHKHTQSHSWPILENISYGDGVNTWGKSWEISDASIADTNTVRNTPDSLRPYVIIPKDVSTSTVVENLKSAYKKGSTTTTADGGIKIAGRISKNCVLCIDNKDVTTAPVYVMSQSAGNKVLSNSDIPTASTPWLKYYYPGNSTADATADDATSTDQRYPHFIEYKFNPNPSDSSNDYPGNIEVRHYSVRKDAFCNFQTSQVFFNATDTSNGQLEFTDPLATPAKMVDNTCQVMSSALVDTLKWSNDFSYNFTEVS